MERVIKDKESLPWGNRNQFAGGVTCGVTNGLSMAGYMFVEEAAKIIVADLYWGKLITAATVTGS